MINVSLRLLEVCSSDQQNAVRLVRNQSSVRHAMYNDHEIGPAEHATWLEDSIKRDDKIVFVVLVGDEVCGVVSVDKLDTKNRTADWAFYLAETMRGGLGVALEYAFLNLAFEEMSLEKLNCEVIETNPAVVRMHGKFGFVEEGFRRQNVIKDDARVGVYLLGITQNEWLRNRDAVFERYADRINNFRLSIENAME